MADPRRPATTTGSNGGLNTPNINRVTILMIGLTVSQTALIADLTALITTGRVVLIQLLKSSMAD